MRSRLDEGRQWALEEEVMAEVKSKFGVSRDPTMAHMDGSLNVS